MNGYQRARSTVMLCQVIRRSASFQQQSLNKTPLEARRQSTRSRKREVVGSISARVVLEQTHERRRTEVAGLGPPKPCVCTQTLLAPKMWRSWEEIGIRGECLGGASWGGNTQFIGTAVRLYHLETMVDLPQTTVHIVVGLLALPEDSHP